MLSTLWMYFIFYNHFQNKEALVCEVYDDFDLRYKLAYEEALRGDTANALRAFFNHYFSGIERDRDMEILRTVYSIQIYAETPHDISQPFRPFHTYVRALIELGKERGEISPGADTDAILMLLTNYMVGMEYCWSLHGGAYDIVKEGMAAFDRMLRGFACE